MKKTTSCNVCGRPTSMSTGRCTNGRCAECHRTHCTPGGNDAPGHNPIAPKRNEVNR